uniref:Uncharacterized protein n=1 Tax=Candidatus Kentrum sp. DK TaxID=2126562 RepID=A0A450S4S4_9GAMM|nr:MAG: hypothetical protein BECKDK2373B_GA0170837_101442 [Candidatus Kentron sp. DK]
MQLRLRHAGYSVDNQWPFLFPARSAGRVCLGRSRFSLLRENTPAARLPDRLAAIPGWRALPPPKTHPERGGEVFPPPPEGGIIPPRIVPVTVPHTRKTGQPDNNPPACRPIAYPARAVPFSTGPRGVAKKNPATISREVPFSTGPRRVDKRSASTIFRAVPFPIDSRGAAKGNASTISQEVPFSTGPRRVDKRSASTMALAVPFPTDPRGAAKGNPSTISPFRWMRFTYPPYIGRRLRAAGGLAQREGLFIHSLDLLIEPVNENPQQKDLLIESINEPIDAVNEPIRQNDPPRRVDKLRASTIFRAVPFSTGPRGAAKGNPSTISLFRWMRFTYPPYIGRRLRAAGGLAQREGLFMFPDYLFLQSDYLFI